MSEPRNPRQYWAGEVEKLDFSLLKLDFSLLKLDFSLLKTRFFLILHPKN